MFNLVLGSFAMYLLADAPVLVGGESWPGASCPSGGDSWQCPDVTSLIQKYFVPLRVSLEKSAVQKPVPQNDEQHVKDRQRGPHKDEAGIKTRSVANASATPLRGSIGADAKNFAKTAAESLFGLVAGWGAPSKNRTLQVEVNAWPHSDSHGRARHIWKKDVLDAEEDPFKPADYMDGDEGIHFFESAKPVQWVALTTCCVAAFLLDLLLLQRLPNTFLGHIGCIGAWIFVAAIFNTWVFSTLGEQAGVEWCAGYFLEWMLSMDNLFVFHLIFKRYSTPPSQIHYAVFVGIFGAVLLRMVFFMVLSTMLHLFRWIRLPFGFLLIWSGIETALGTDEEEEHVKDAILVRTVKKLLGNRFSDAYDEKGGLFRIAKNGQVQATALLIVVLCLESTDILFAIDSVSAKVAQIPNQFLAFSSSVLAMFGLRAMFFVVGDLVDMFSLLQYGLCLILVFIGVQLIFAHWLHLPASTVCCLILSVFTISIAGSWAVKRDRGNQERMEDNPQAS